MTFLGEWQLKFFSDITRWFQGPGVLWEPESSWKRSLAQEENQNGIRDLESKKQIKDSSVITKEDFLSRSKNRYSCCISNSLI